MSKYIAFSKWKDEDINTEGVPGEWPKRIIKTSNSPIVSFDPKVIVMTIEDYNNHLLEYNLQYLSWKNDFVQSKKSLDDDRHALRCRVEWGMFVIEQFRLYCIRKLPSNKSMAIMSKIGTASQLLSLGLLKDAGFVMDIIADEFFSSPYDETILLDSFVVSNELGNKETLAEVTVKDRFKKMILNEGPKP